MSEKTKHVQSSGKRKSAIARAVLTYPAKGQIKINNVPIDLYEPEIARYRIQEVLEVINHPKIEKSTITNLPSLPFPILENFISHPLKSGC